MAGSEKYHALIAKELITLSFGMESSSTCLQKARYPYKVAKLLLVNVFETRQIQKPLGCYGESLILLGKGIGAAVSALIFLVVIKKSRFSTQSHTV